MFSGDFWLINEDLTVAVLGLVTGIVLGLAARLGRFCTLGALEDWHYGNSSLRLRMWTLAIGSAIAAVFLADLVGFIDVSKVRYLTNSTTIAGAIFGGLVFGLGMALAGNCGFGALSRMGGGEIRAFLIVVVIGLSAMAVTSGPVAQLRILLFPNDLSDTPQGIAHMLAGATGLPLAPLGLIIGLAIVAASIGWKKRIDHAVFWGLPVGLAVAAGLIGNALISAHGFGSHLVLSHSFSAPLGETMIYTMLSSGLAPSFAVGSVLGVVVGAVAGSLWRGSFRWQACDDQRELRRQLFGATMMGAGAAISLGCSIGQGLSAMSALAITAPLTLGAIWLGGWLGLRYLIEGALPFQR